VGLLLVQKYLFICQSNLEEWMFDVVHTMFNYHMYELTPEPLAFVSTGGACRVAGEKCVSSMISFLLYFMEQSNHFQRHVCKGMTKNLPVRSFASICRAPTPSRIYNKCRDFDLNKKIN
jgi:hypothetical protein